MLATYHNHSTWSDGQTSISEIVATARRMGIGELGIADHFTLHPSGTAPRWSMPTDRLHAYVDEVLSMKSDDGPVIRLGVEADWFPSMADEIGIRLAEHPFDYVIGSVHYVGDFLADGNARDWECLNPAEREQLALKYWTYVESMAASGLYDIVAHLDICKKNGFCPDTSESVEAGRALDAIADSKMVVEINTNGWYKRCHDAYPTLSILKECRKRDIPVTISADAHHPDFLVRDFDKAAIRLRKAGYSEIARFDGREVRFEPIELAVICK